jgi:hypothetical protein
MWSATPPPEARPSAPTPLDIPTKKASFPYERSRNVIENNGWPLALPDKCMRIKGLRGNPDNCLKIIEIDGFDGKKDFEKQV